MRYRVEFMWHDDTLSGWHEKAAFVERHEAHFYCYTRSLTWPERHWRMMDTETGECELHITSKTRS